MRDLATRDLASCLLLVMTALASGCDPLYRPLVYNSLSLPVAIKVVWENGNSDEHRLGPHQFLFAGLAESPVHSLHVLIDGAEIQVLSASDLRELSGSEGVDAVALAVDESGLKTISESEVEEIRRSRWR